MECHLPLFQKVFICLDNQRKTFYNVSVKQLSTKLLGGDGAVGLSYFHINQSLRKVHLLRKRSLQQAMRKQKLQPSWLPLLHYVEEHPGCTQAEVAENLALTPAAITLATQRLAAQKMLVKKTDQKNLRRNILSVTAVGQERLRKMGIFFEEFDQKMFQGLSEAELCAFQKTLDRITTNITGEDKNEVSRQVITDLLREIREDTKETI